MTVHTASEADPVATGLAGAAGRYFGKPATIESLKRESGGASRQTWSFDALVDGKRHGLVLRRDPPTAGPVGGTTGAGRRRLPGHCWYMATTAPATISPTRAA